MKRRLTRGCLSIIAPICAFFFCRYCLQYVKNRLFFLIVSISLSVALKPHNLLPHFNVFFFLQTLFIRIFQSFSSISCWILALMYIFA